MASPAGAVPGESRYRDEILWLHGSQVGVALLVVRGL
jgi:hypothetical protein